MWEYITIQFKSVPSFSGGKFDSVEMETELNRLGSEGYELISIVASNKAFGETGYLIAFLKRRT
ncbi:MAG: DUF4177 domain-containing protein [bacterium]|jgi:hypothetical protein|nr:DUF4177 domain-containing protein [bacterium]